MGANRIILSTLLLALAIIATTIAPAKSQNGGDKSEFKGSPEKILQLANDLYRAQRFAKAKEAYVEVLKKDPSNAMLVSISNLIKVIGTFLIEIRKIK